MKSNKINIAHEAPVSLMPLVQQVTDYDYALSVCFDKVPGYYDFFVDAKKKGRWVLLDNGIFEEGVPMEASLYADWITKLQPDEYVVPDCLEGKDVTINNFDNWLANYSDLPGRKIGVAQGKNLKEFIECYKYMADKADKIAISFDYSFYLEEMEKKVPHLNKWQRWQYGRAYVINYLQYTGILSDKPHHCLGASLPYEISTYRNLKCIESFDSSNPVVYAIEKGRYPEHIGDLTTKISKKLKDLILTPSTNELIVNTIHNIAQFRYQNGL